MGRMFHQRSVPGNPMWRCDGVAARDRFFLPPFPGDRMDHGNSPPLPRAGTRWSVCEQERGEVGEDVVGGYCSAARGGGDGRAGPGGTRKRSAAPGGGDGRPGGGGGEITSGHGDARRMLGHTPHPWGGVVCRGGAGEMEAEG